MFRMDSTSFFSPWYVRVRVLSFVFYLFLLCSAYYTYTIAMGIPHNSIHTRNPAFLLEKKIGT